MHSREKIIPTSKRYFNQWKKECIASMTLIASLDEGDLYYYDGGGTGEVWVVVSKRSIIVAGRKGENNLEVMKSKVKIWNESLKKGETPSGDYKIIGGPVYGAYKRFLTGKIKVVWFNPGDWMATVRKLPLPSKLDKLPQGWPEGDKERIMRLRIKRESQVS